jgi:hypothetical protein
MAMSANFQGEILALLNDEGDDDRRLDNPNDSNQRRKLSRRGGGSTSVERQSSHPPPPPPPDDACTHGGDKERRRKQRRLLPRSSWNHHRKHQSPASAPPHYVVALVAFVLSCAIYIRWKGYRIKLRVRGWPPSFWSSSSSSSSSFRIRRERTPSSSSLSSSSSMNPASTTTTTAAAAAGGGGGGRGSSSFLDTAWIGKDGAQYQSIIPPSHIDFSIPRRSRWVRGKDRHCDDVLLFLSPSPSDGYVDDRGGTTTGVMGSGEGEGAVMGEMGEDSSKKRTPSGSYELRGYILAAIMATYTERAMVVLDAPHAGTIGNDGRMGASSWYDCSMGDVVTTDSNGGAADATAGGGDERRKRNGRRKGGGAPDDDDRKNERVGINRLLQHPQWLSHGCPVPCSSEYDYSMWDDVRRGGMGEDAVVERVTCRSDNDRQAFVSVYGPDDIYDHFQRMWNEEMSKLTYSDAYRWAIRLGAHGHEARAYANLRREGDKWNYIAYLMARSGIVRFTPWVAVDIRARIKMTNLPLNSPYTAISAYRGGDGDDGMLASESTASRPLDLLAYFQRLESTGCNEDRVRPVYIATDDPGWIQDEIDRFLGSYECRDSKFILGSSVVDPIDVADVGRTDCSRLHRAKVSAMAELMILAKSETYLGGSDRSDVDWLVRVFRATVDITPDTTHAGSCYD